MPLFRPLPRSNKASKAEQNRERPRPLKPVGHSTEPRCPDLKGKPQRQVLTVSEAVRQVKRFVEETFPPVWILGEVSNFRRPRSGHMYFTLKDGGALLNAVMFRGAQGGLVAPLEDGLEVLVRGRLSIYDRGSEVQVIAERIEPHGRGALELQREELRREYQKAGLLNPSRKRALPRYPRCLGIVTSPTGAAIRDILTTLDRRWPRLHILIAPARVQGTGAAEQVAAGIEALNAHDVKPELIIVSRGGGSVEQLWPFNLEPVCYAIARSEVPVVTGLGHETDETLADLIADSRAPTPTAAAELVVPVLEQHYEQLDDLKKRSWRRMRSRLREARRRLKELERRYSLRILRADLSTKSQQLDRFSERFEHVIGERLKQVRLQLDHGRGLLSFSSLFARLRARRESLQSLERRFQQATKSQLRCARYEFDKVDRRHFESALRQSLKNTAEQLAQLSTKIQALSPLKVLRRGYSLVQKSETVIVDPKQLKTGDSVRIRFANGEAWARITKIDDEPEFDEEQANS